MQATSVSDPKNQAPSNELVERVARAIYDLDKIGVREWEDAPISTREDCLACARAAIEAMREPTEAMQAAGAHRRENRKPVAEIWRTMIGEALR